MTRMGCRRNAIDTSALLAILQREAKAKACADAIRAADALVMSAGTLTEALIVSGKRSIGPEMMRLIDSLPLSIVPVTVASARRAAGAYDIWGRGVHRAALNFGDCFAYEIAKSHECPLLFVGHDFSQADVLPALLEYKAPTLSPPAGSAPSRT